MATFVLTDDVMPTPDEPARRVQESGGGWLPADLEAVASAATRPGESRLVSVLLAGPAILVTCAALMAAVLTRPVAALRVAWGATHRTAPR